MATGPEHYTEAEQHLTYAMSGALGMETDFHLAAAQVHATLAQAAAVGTYGTDETRSGADLAAWERVSGEHTVQQQQQRAEETNPAAPDLIAAMGQHSSAHGTAAVYDPADPHDAALAEQARTEYVDYAEAEAVREIGELMDLDAAGVESWEQL